MALTFRKRKQSDTQQPQSNTKQLQLPKRQRAKQNKQPRNKKLYRYSGYNKKGKLVSGTISAFSEDDARIKLEKKGLIVNVLQQTKVRKIRKLKMNEMYFFAVNLANFMQTGFPISEALELLTTRSLNNNFEQVLEDITILINGGMSLSDAMAQTKAFSPLFVSFVRSGENTGRIDEALENIAFFYETEIQVNSKFRNAMTYPVILSISSIVVIFVYVFYVVPNLIGIYESVNAPLPLITRMVIGAGDFIANFWWLLVAAAVGGLWIYRRLAASIKPIALSIDQFWFNMPIFGKLLLTPEYLRLSTVIYNGYLSGLNIIDILRNAEDIVTSRTMKTHIHNAITKINKGATLSNAFDNTGLDPVFVKTIALGERAGALEDSLKRYIRLVQHDYFQAIDSFSTKIEPALLVLIGIVVGFVVIALYLPIFNLVPTMLQSGGI